ncbi:MAG: START-like domain-containing protein [Bacteroidaceae bacterium]|nr:START-like domain-containing protein [Bacteroidaceae bacterium]
MASDKSATTKTKVVFEYELSSQSISMIWDAIATAPGMTAWFADEVSVSGKKYHFKWGKHESRDAELINTRQNTYVRFHWLDEEPGTFFEIRILKNDLTANCSLEITDFADPDGADDVRSLWDTSIDALHRCGL